MTDRWKRFREGLNSAFSGWGFTSFERRAILLLCLLILIASGYRYYRNRDLGLRLSELPVADSLYDPYTEPRQPLHLLLDLNQATSRDFQRLPGIGPVKADKIIETRTKLGGFTTVEQLDQVEGIGPKTLDRLKPYLVVSSQNTAVDTAKLDSAALNAKRNTP